MDKTHLRNSATSTAPTLPDLSWGLCDVGSTVTLWSGSSPLARGLRCRNRAPNIRRRIVPARAGFTHRAADAHSRTTDHPRSRGVYLLQSMRVMSPWGSSPLARGLPRVRLHHLDKSRIIPARAGFTSRERRRTLESRDHPRSRGVYECESCDDTDSFGSSPLARGLLRAEAAECRVSGIIPARAGFTWFLRL